MYGSQRAFFAYEDRHGACFILHLGGERDDKREVEMEISSRGEGKSL